MEKLNKLSGLFSLITMIVAVLVLALSTYSVLHKSTVPSFNRGNFPNMQNGGNFGGNTNSNSNSTTN